jgi:hypothetical protein
MDVTILTIAEGGTITLTREQLHHLGIPSGGRIEVTILPDHQLEIKGASRRKIRGRPASRERGPDESE